MVRILAGNEKFLLSFPLARGDGPSKIGQKRKITMFSPRAWGWSDDGLRMEAVSVVIPSRVGMVRSDTACSGVAFRYPLARGDGPNFDLITESPE